MQTCMSKNAVNCNSVTAELPKYLSSIYYYIIGYPYLFTQMLEYTRIVQFWNTRTEFFKVRSDPPVLVFQICTFLVCPRTGN